MGARELIKNEIMEQANLAQAELDEIINRKVCSQQEVIDRVHNYCCYKFFLVPEQMIGKSLNEMAAISIDRSIELKIPVAKESEIATTCGAAGSAPMKIALLLNSIKKCLDLSVNPYELGCVNSTQELGMLVYRNMFE